MCNFSHPARSAVAKPISLENFSILAERLFRKTRYLYLSCSAEPLMTPHFDKILDIVANYNISFISYATNGLLLKDSFIDATFRNKVNEIIISVDGAKKSTYENIRVGANWEKLIKKLKMLVARKRKEKRNKTKIRFNFTVMKENCVEILDFTKWCMQWEPYAIQLRLFYPRSGSFKHCDSKETIQHYQKQLPQIRKICKQHGVYLLVDKVPHMEIRVRDEGVRRLAQFDPTVLPKSTTLENDNLRKDLPNQYKAHKKRINCQLPWLTGYIHVNGDYFPCPVYPKPVGNILRSTLSQIENNIEMCLLKQSIFKSPMAVCYECQQLKASGVE